MYSGPWFHSWLERWSIWEWAQSRPSPLLSLLRRSGCYMGSSTLSDHSETGDLRDFFLAALAVEMFMILFFWECKVYDLSSAMFTAWLLGWLARGETRLYQAIFPLACVNRETAFILIIVFGVYCLGRILWTSWIVSVGYQVLVFLSTRGLLAWHFADSPGQPFWFRPIENLQMYADAPLQSLVYLAGTAVVLWLCLRGWKEKPLLLRTAFAIMAPALAALYIFFGYTFEIRVFAEIYPISWTLIWWQTKL